VVKVVGLAGPAGVGKSTTTIAFVEIFKKLYPALKTKNIAFADPMYNLISHFTQIPISTLKSQNYKNIKWNQKTAPMPCLNGWSPRRFLQVIGTDCFRNEIHNDFWVQLSIKQAEDNDIIFVEDARFDNEYEMCNIVIELKRDGIQYACDHPSAMPPDKKYIDFVIELHENVDLNSYAKKIYDLLKE